MGTHPTNADREEAARPVIERFMAAVAAGLIYDVAACLAENVEWLVPDGRISGRAAARERMSGARPPGPVRWDRIQQHGAHAVLGWTAPSAAGGFTRGTTVVEVRRGEIVFRADG